MSMANDYGNLSVELKMYRREESARERGHLADGGDKTRSEYLEAKS